MPISLKCNKRWHSRREKSVKAHASEGQKSTWYHFAVVAMRADARNPPTSGALIVTLLLKF